MSKSKLSKCWTCNNGKYLELAQAPPFCGMCGRVGLPKCADKLVADIAAYRYAFEEERDRILEGADAEYSTRTDSNNTYLLSCAFIAGAVWRSAHPVRY
jgi:hypothetical protein